MAATNRPEQIYARRFVKRKPFSVEKLSGREFSSRPASTD